MSSCSPFFCWRRRNSSRAVLYIKNGNTNDTAYARGLMQHAAGAADDVAARELAENTCAAENCQMVVPVDRRLRCSRCKLTWYCSKSCQVSAWPLHKINCKLPRLPVPTNRVHYTAMEAKLQVFTDYYNARSWVKILRLETKMITHVQTCLDDQVNKDAACQIYQTLARHTFPCLTCTERYPSWKRRRR